MAEPRLAIEGLVTEVATRRGRQAALRGVTIGVAAGETLCLVGESGSGKSLTAMSAMRLLPAGARVAAGRIRLDGQDLLPLAEAGMGRIRGRRIGLVFQDSMTSLNPVLTIGRQITEGMELHLGLAPAEAMARARALLEEVGVPDPGRRLGQYPHELSGGLRQRAAIAVALAANPEVLIADEPTTALDVTTQAQILELLRREQRTRGMALILITHDMGVVARMADRVAVMYAGRVVETGAVDAVFADPAHPYTRGLLAAMPRVDRGGEGPLPAIPGVPPRVGALPAGCAFAPRCPFAFSRCATEDPPLAARGAGRAAACHLEILP